MTFNVRIDFEQANQAADKIEALSSRALVRFGAVDAVNEVATRFMGVAQKGMNADLNLSDAYVQSKMRLTKATSTPRAEIVTAGDLTILSRYPHMQLTAPAPRGRRGDSARGIPPGQKAAGVSVSIRRSGANVQPRWFLMRLKAGTTAGQNVGVFVRTARGLKHIYGPAPYSLFRYQVNTRTDALTEDLTNTAAERIGSSVQKALS